MKLDPGPYIYKGQTFMYWDDGYPFTSPVGVFAKPNPFGLYDMHGNVWQWCQDVWHDTYVGAPTDGTAWVTDGEPGRRVARGGSWCQEAGGARSAFRRSLEWDGRTFDFGFRVVLVAP
jgi:formylglycine-generating enzyme required for sulfatase activity